MPVEPVRVGIVGTGVISTIYLENSHKFKEYEVIAVADIIEDRAKAQAEKFDVPKVLSVDDLIADPDVEMVLNLTIPAVHAEIAQQTLRAGKSAYSEKPLATTREDGQAILDVARATGLLVGCAPDTFLGGGIQTVNYLIEQGTIGQPVAAFCHFATPGPEKWHPDPGFFFQPGAGPILDMGPYYLTNLVALFGPMKRVMALASAPVKERIIGKGPKAGQTIPVNVDTTAAALIEMANGVIATLLISWDVWGSDAPNFEVYGTEGALSGWDPNTFRGPIRLRNAELYAEHGSNMVWEEVPLTHGNHENSRGLGLADMAIAMRTGRKHRANGELAYHVLDGMLSILESAATGQPVELRSTCERPAPLKPGQPDWTIGD